MDRVQVETGRVRGVFEFESGLMESGFRFALKSPSSLRVKTAGREFNADCSIDLATDSANFTRSDEGYFALRRSLAGVRFAESSG